MARQLEVVFERGILRPVEPLTLEENQHVLVTIADVPVEEPSCTRRAEQEWLRSHSLDYGGQWVALHGGMLLSHGPKAGAVRDEARRKGIQRPLLVRVPDEPGRPSAGLL
jgi:predicted DNA-binding antitoxin AbrB/MazE fold protein